MITAKDFQKATDYPLASKDSSGALRVGAAIGTGIDTDRRIKMLVDAGVDVITIDTAHAHTLSVIETIKRIKKDYPNLQLIAGNIVTADAAKALVKSGVDALKVGIGPGSICTTRVIAGAGVPQITAVANVSEAISKSGVPVISDLSLIHI